MRHLTHILTFLGLLLIFLSLKSDNSQEIKRKIDFYFNDSNSFFKPLFNLPQIDMYGSQIQGKSNGHIYLISEKNNKENIVREYFFWGKSLICVSEKEHSKENHYYFENDRLIESDNKIDKTQFLIYRAKHLQDSLEYFNNEICLLGHLPSIRIKSENTKFENAVNLIMLNKSELEHLEKIEMRDNNYLVIGFLMSADGIPGYLLEYESKNNKVHKPIIDILNRNNDKAEIYFTNIKILTPTNDTLNYPTLILKKNFN